MNTFLKVLLFIVVALLAIKFLPFLLLPVLIAGVGLLLMVGLVVAGVATVAGVGVAAVVAILAVLTAIVVVLAPLWIPVLVVIGLVALIRRSTRPAVAAR